MSRPLVAMVGKSPCNGRMVPLGEGEATVIDKSSAEDTMRSLVIDMCRGPK